MSTGSERAMSTSERVSEDATLTSILNSIRTIERTLRMENVETERQLGISLAQLFVLQLLDEQPAHSINELAERTLTHQSSVSVVVRRLTESGLVEKRASASDARRVEIAITEAGRALVQRARPATQSTLFTGLRRLTTAQLDALDDALRAWLEAVGLKEEAPAMFGEVEPSAR